MHPEDTAQANSTPLKLNRDLRFLVFVNTVINFTVGLFAPFYAVYVEKIGGSAAMAGISWALFSIVSGILILLLSRWELRIHRRHVLLAVGYLVRALAFLSYAFLDSIPQLFITQIIWGIASAIGTPAFDALYTSSTSKEAAIVEWSYWEASSAIAVGVAALLGGLLIQTVGFKILFIIMSTISGSLGFYLLYQRHKIKAVSRIQAQDQSASM